MKTKESSSLFMKIIQLFIIFSNFALFNLQFGYVCVNDENSLPITQY